MKSLKEAYKDSFLMGNIYTPKVLENKALQQMLKEQFNVLTSENIMKPALIQPKQGKFTFDAADDLMTYAKVFNFKVVGHTLVWHQQTLSWIDEANTSREEALVLLRTHMTEIMTRYKGEIIAWDVLNEAIEDGVEEETKNWRKHLRSTPWLRMIGVDYIEHVFQIANELDPNAKLYYNDYNLNYEQKREATYYMVKELKELGIPIHGIGMQGHYHTNTPISTVADSLELFSRLENVEISITELDVTVTGSEKSSRLSAEHELIQAQYYAQLFQIYKKYEKVIKRITFWGTDDQTSWRGDRFPTIFNQDYSPKKSFEAIVDPEGFLQAYPLIDRDSTQTAIANYGTPELGNEETWLKFDPVPLVRQLTAWEGATAVAYAQWNEENLYLLTDVEGSKPHANDSIDIFIHSHQLFKITITAENKVDFNEKPEISGFESIVLTTDHGYQIYAKLPLQVLSTAYVFGFDMQVNDANEQGIRQSCATWNSFTEPTLRKVEEFGNLQFMK